MGNNIYDVFLLCSTLSHRKFQSYQKFFEFFGVTGTRSGQGFRNKNNFQINVEIVIFLCRKSGTDIWIKQFSAVHPFEQSKNITFDICLVNYYFS